MPRILPSIRFLFRCSPFLLLFLFSTLISSIAQDRCATFINHPINNRENQAKFEKWMKEKIQERRAHRPNGGANETTYQIPIVVHIIHNGEPIGIGANIPDAQVYSQIDVINRDYKRLNADTINTPPEFRSVAGKINIEFVLAKQTPDGLPTNGIVRIHGSQTSWQISNYDILHSQSYWPAEDYLNVWVGNATDFLGFSQFPMSGLIPGLDGSPDDRFNDGVLVTSKAFGSDDDGDFHVDKRYNKGRTLTHEIGHFLGLFHTWGGCGSTDYCDDTPTQDASTGGCPSVPQPSCIDGVDKMYQNYLDYTNDACMNLFTHDQVERMTVILENSIRRNSLLTSHALVDPTPFADDLGFVQVITPVVMSCSSVSPIVEVKNYGSNKITSARIRLKANQDVIETLNFALDLDPMQTALVAFNSLSFSGGRTQCSFDIIETNGGPDGNPTNNNKIANTQYFAPNSSVRIPIRENFDDNYLAQWTVINPTNGTKWKTITTNFNSSLTFESFSNLTEGDEALLISPSLDLSHTDQASMFFDFSYAFNPTRTNAEKFAIKASLDCSNVFDITLYEGIGDELSNIKSSTNWVPQADSAWQRKFINLAPLVGNTDVKIAFVSTNGHGNNIYIDNIEFFNSDLPNQVNVSVPFYIYYNSTTNTEADFNVKFNLPLQDDVKVDITDMMGRNVFDNTYYNILNETLPVDLIDVAAGIYVIRFTTKTNVYAARVFVDTK
jgi:hypothetical protein